MGNSLTADCRPLSLDQIASEAAKGVQGGAAPPATNGDANVKVWRICGRGRHVTCEGVDMVNQQLELDELSTYLILVLKRKGRGHTTRTLPESIGPVLSGTFTPRGLKCPFFVANDSLFIKMVYIYYGKLAGALPKAKALKHGLDIEKLLLEKGACERLYVAGDPVDVDVPNVFNAYQRGSSSRGAAPAGNSNSHLSSGSVHLVRCLEDQAYGVAGNNGAASTAPENASFASSIGQLDARSTPQQPPPAIARPVVPGLKLAGVGDGAKPPGLPLSGVPPCSAAQDNTSPSSSEKSAHSSFLGSEVSSSLNESRGYLENHSGLTDSAPTPSNPPAAAASRPGVPALNMPRPATAGAAGAASLGLGLGLGLNLGALSHRQPVDDDGPPPAARGAWDDDGGRRRHRDANDASFAYEPAPERVPAGDEELDEKRLHHQREQKMRDAAAVCSEILPHLAVSGQAPAESLQTLLDNGVTAIVNSAATVVPSKYPDYFCYTSARLKDAAGENIMDFFPRCIAAIEAAREREGKCLVHCHQGVSRSVTLCAAYLMWRQRIASAEEAVDAVRRARDIARPNAGFVLRLKEWGRHLAQRPEVTVHRLKSLSDDDSLPVFALQQPAAATAYTFSSSSVYLITTTAPDVVLSAPSLSWLWVGPRVRDAHAAADLAKMLVPEVLQYTAYEGVVGGPPIVKFHSEADGAAGDLGGARFEVADENGEEGDAWPAWAEYMRNLDARMANEAEAQRQAQRSTSHTSSTLQMELLNVKELYVAGDPPAPLSFAHDERYSGAGFDEDEFWNFAEDTAASIAVFLKLRKDDRVVDVWIGRDCSQAGAPEAAAQTVYESFKQWTRTHTPWGGAVDWSTVRMGWVVDGQDDNADVQFSARWVSS